MLNTTKVKKYIRKFDEFRKQLSEWTGKEIKTLLDVALISGTLDIERHMDLELPEWTRNVYPNGEMLNAVNAYYKIMSYNLDRSA